MVQPWADQLKPWAQAVRTQALRVLWPLWLHAQPYVQRSTNTLDRYLAGYPAWQIVLLTTSALVLILQIWGILEAIYTELREQGMSACKSRGSSQGWLVGFCNCMHCLGTVFIDLVNLRDTCVYAGLKQFFFKALLSLPFLSSYVEKEKAKAQVPCC